MSAMRQPFRAQKSGTNCQSNKQLDVNSYKIDPHTPYAPQARQVSSMDPDKSSSQPDVTAKLSKEMQRATSHTSVTRAPKSLVHNAAPTSRTRFTEPSHKTATKAAARNAGSETPESHGIQQSESIRSARPNIDPPTLNKDITDMHEETCRTQIAGRKRSHQSLEAPKDASIVDHGAQNIRQEMSDSKAPGHASKRRHSGPVVATEMALRSMVKEIVPSEILDSDAPPSSQPSSEDYTFAGKESPDTFSFSESRPSKVIQPFIRDACHLLHESNCRLMQNRLTGQLNWVRRMLARLRIPGCLTMLLI
jgi:hypothetical protein